MALGLAKGLTQHRGPEESRYHLGRNPYGLLLDGSDYLYNYTTLEYNFGEDDLYQLDHVVIIVFKANSYTTNDTVSWQASHYTGDKLYLAFTTGNGGYVQWNIYNDNEAASDEWGGVRSDSTVTNGEWVHCIGIREWDGATETIKFWLNGVQQSGAYNSANVGVYPVKHGMGRDGDGTGLGTDYFNGTYQEYNMAYWGNGSRYGMDDDFAKSLYNNGQPRNPRGFLGPGTKSYRFKGVVDDSAIWSLYDPTAYKLRNESNDLNTIQINIPLTAHTLARYGSFSASQPIDPDAGDTNMSNGGF